MCIGIPMQVVETGLGTALCEGFGERRRVNMLMVGDQPPGTWVMVFLGSAREVLEPDEAQRVGDALRALQAVMSGNVETGSDLDAFFPDLVGSAGGRSGGGPQ